MSIIASPSWDIDLKRPAVLARSDDLAVLYKPAGMAVQADARGDEDLASWYGHDAVPIGRLDRPVCGLVLYGCSHAGRRRLHSAQTQRKIRKIYRAKTSVKLTEINDVLRHYWQWKKGRADALNYPSNEAAKVMETRLLNNWSNGVLELQLITGRRHQLRAQLKALGSAILGDRKYGGAPATHLHLACTQLSFPLADASTATVVLPDPAIKALGLAAPEA